MRIDVITLFPEYFSGVLSASLLGKALARGDLEVHLHQLRDFAAGKHRIVDDAPYGGGRGMVMKVEPLVGALEAIAEPGARRILLSARGAPFTQARAGELAACAQVVLVCGRYEGVDERFTAYVDEQLCIGDYVLSGGEAAAAVVIDAVARLVPGVVGNEESLVEESFAKGLLEYPQYTRPEVFRGARVPEVLLSGNHAEVARWRRQAALAATEAVRPDLLAAEPSTAPGPGIAAQAGRPVRPSAGQAGGRPARPSHPPEAADTASTRPEAPTGPGSRRP
jgi:tRNA (guanine37-N1)-methyltransferase